MKNHIVNQNQRNKEIHLTKTSTSKSLDNNLVLY